MTRKISDRTLRRWLATGRPSRVGRRIETDPTVALRLDQLSAFEPAHNDAINALVEPSPGFDQRTETAVKAQLSSFTIGSTLVDLLGLGLHTGRALFGAGDVAGEAEPDPEDQPNDS